MVAILVLLDLKLPFPGLWLRRWLLDRRHHFHEELGIGCHFLEGRKHSLELFHFLLFHAGVGDGTVFVIHEFIWVMAVVLLESLAEPTWFLIILAVYF